MTNKLINFLIILLYEFVFVIQLLFVLFLIQWSILQPNLPPQVNVLTIEPIAQTANAISVLFRIEHIYDINEHSTFSISIRLVSLMKGA